MYSVGHCNINRMVFFLLQIMTRNSNDAKELADAKKAVPSAIHQAADAAGVEPTTSNDLLLRDAENSGTLQRAFKDEMEQSIRQRLASDPDFNEEKYPNAAKYFKSPPK